MDLRIYLNNIDISHIVDGEININNAVNGKGASVGFMYHLGDPLEAPNILKGDVVRIEYSDGSLMFHGTVDTLNEGKNARDNKIPVVALDDTYQLKLTSVDKKVYVNKTVSQIMADVLVGTNLTTDPAAQTVIPRIVFNRSNLRDVVYKLAKAQQADWVIDNGVLRFIRAPSEQAQAPTRDTTQDFTRGIGGASGTRAMFSYNDTLFFPYANKSTLSYTSNRVNFTTIDIDGGRNWACAGADVDQRDGSMFILETSSTTNVVTVYDISDISRGFTNKIRSNNISTSILTNGASLLFVPGKTESDDDIIYIGAQTPSNRIHGFRVNRTTKEITHDSSLTVSLSYIPRGSALVGDLIFIAEIDGARKVYSYNRDDFSRASDYDFTLESGFQCEYITADSRNIFAGERYENKRIAYTLPVKPANFTTITLAGNNDIIRDTFEVKSVAVPPYSSVSVVGETGEGTQDVSTKIGVPSTFNASSFFIQTGIRFRNLTSIVRTRGNKTLTVGVYGLDGADTTKELLWSQSGGFIARGAGYSSGDLQASDELTLLGKTEYQFSGTANVPVDGYLFRDAGDYNDYGATEAVNLYKYRRTGNTNAIQSICRPFFLRNDAWVDSVEYDAPDTLNGVKVALVKISNDLTIDNTGNYSFSRVESVKTITNVGLSTGRKYTRAIRFTTSLEAGQYILCIYTVRSHSTTNQWLQTTDKITTSLPLMAMHITSANSSNYFTNGTDLSTITPDDFVTQASDPETSTGTLAYDTSNNPQYVPTTNSPINFGTPSDAIIETETLGNGTLYRIKPGVTFTTDLSVTYGWTASLGVGFRARYATTKPTATNLTTHGTQLDSNEGGTTLSITKTIPKASATGGLYIWFYTSAWGNDRNVSNARLRMSGSWSVPVTGARRSFNFMPMEVRLLYRSKPGLTYYTFVPVASDELAKLAAERIAERLKNNKIMVSFAIHNQASDKIYLNEKYRPGAVIVVKAANRSGIEVDVRCIISSVSYSNHNGFERMQINAESERFDDGDDVFADLIQKYNEPD